MVTGLALGSISACDGPGATAPHGASATPLARSAAIARGEPRILSLSPGVSRVLIALDRVDAIVGVDAFSRELPELAGLPSLGGLFAPDLERAVELAPTLVIGVDSAQQRGFFARLEERGVRVERIVAQSLPEVLASFRRIGEAVGRGAEARALVARLDGELEAVSARGRVLPRRRVAMIVEREPLYVVGGGSFVSELIALAGGDNVFGDLDAPYPQISLEALAERAPELLLDSTTPGDEPGAETRARDYWGRFPWAGRVERVAAGEVTLPSPAIATSARRLQALIHELGPELP